ncbi:helix-turn-helix domain-containing protein [Georgenia yuyongxinii]|uniref:Helix-turn-helix domain-containing protein n=1 Tax=Georgenia yuyongxinii TaxID=2589797 RepID=A0A5B8C4C1_9MICO|nr:helix-turn-helix domain-containing protein [Georgenia yuyongxinii]QDC25413.1 helix-turn-helix domain-containing protein [Georgenia yuyongxinii]
MGATGTVHGRPAGAGSTRVRVLQTLRDVPEGLGAHELAAKLDLHPNTVRFHLGRLEQDGLVHRRVAHPSVPGRPPLRFTAAPQPNALGTRREFRALAEALASVLADQVPGAPELTEQTGRAWAQRLTEAWTGPPPDANEAIDMLADALAGIGFDPQITSDRHQLSLLQRHCPFLEVAQEHRDVVCSLQLGVIRGVLERLGAPVEVTRLVPFALPQGCLVQFTQK